MNEPNQATDTSQQQKMNPTQFRDRAGRKWNLQPDIGLCKKIKRAIGADIPNMKAPDGSNILTAIMQDGDLVEAMVWKIIEADAKARNVPDFGEGEIVGFWDAMGAEEIASAAACLESCVLGFQRRGAEVLKAALAVDRAAAEELAADLVGEADVTGAKAKSKAAMLEAMLNPPQRPSTLGT